MKKQFLKLMTTAILLLAILTTCKKDKDVAVTGITLNKSTLTMDANGSQEYLIATVLPTDATNQNVTWESSNNFVATVIGNGLVTALTPGQATIMARTEDGNKTASCAITVATREDLLTQEKGWILTAATSSPCYDLSLGDCISNLFDGYFMDCELDDVIYFRKNKLQILSPGKDKKTYNSGIFGCKEATEKTLGSWNLIGNDNLEFFFPSLSDFELDVKILSIDGNTLKLSLPFYDDYMDKNYVFTLTYTKAN